LGGITTEGKGVFDVLVKQRHDVLGLSIKSRELADAKRIGGATKFEHAYLEISNSSAKFWKVLGEHGISEADFRGERHAERIGKLVTGTVNSWYVAAEREHPGLPPGRRINVDESVHLAISYSKDYGGERDYQIHSFELLLPVDLDWRFPSNRCLRGYESQNSERPLIEFYGLSGGHVKYYPPTSKAKFSSDVFRLEKVEPISILEKAEKYWPEQWRNAGG
jgi:hypothetical protein